MLDFGRRLEQRWPYYVLCRRPPDTRDARLRPAPRAEVPLLFLVQEAAEEADAEERRGEEEEEEAGQD